MRFCVLGPVEVWHEGRSLAVGQGRERRVLVALLLNADRLTPTNRLVDAMWTVAPPSAMAQLHNMISSLRRRFRVGGTSLLVSRPGGYELRLGSHELDLAEFRQLVEQGRRAGSDGHREVAVATYGRALALWRGSALADIPDEFVGDIRQALHEERLAAAEARLDAELTLARFDDVLRDVAPLVVDFPYRERLHEIKMSALVGAGRRADALATYRQAYRRFIDDLGVAPGASLQRLEQRILSEENAALADRPTPRQLPRAATVVIGRDKVIAEVRAELRRQDRAAGTVGVLTGSGGVGKTTVALAAAHSVGGCFADGQLYVDLRGTQKTPADPHHVCGRLLRDLGVAGASVPDDRDERIGMYRSRLADRRVLVVLDDAASEKQVRPLLPSTAGSAAVITSRRQLAGLVGAQRWTIPVLSPGAALNLLVHVIGAERASGDPAAATEIANLCGHLPLAVCVAAARLSVHPEWTLAGFRRRLVAEQGRLDQLAVGDLDVRASFALSYRALDARRRRLFRRLGLVVAPDWPAWVAGELIGESSDTRVERMVDDLVDTHLVEPLGDDPVAQPRFRLHALVADFARERASVEDSPADRVEAQLRVLDGWLARATEADERSGHGMVSATGLPAPALSLGHEPPVPDEPAEWFETERVSLLTAIDHASLLGRADLAGGLALRLAGFLAARSYEDDRERALGTALSCARTTGENDVLVRLLSAMFAMRSQRDQYAELPAIASEELRVARRLDDPEREVQALNHAGRAARMCGRFTEATGWLEQALAVARGARIQPVLAGRVFDALATLHVDLGQPERALPLFEEAIALHRDAGGARTLAIRLRSYGVTLMDLGRPADAELALREALGTARTMEDDRGSAWIEHAQADLDMRAGRWPAAAARLDRALRTHERVADREGLANVLRSLGDLAAGRGTPRDAVEPLRQSLRAWRELGARLDQAQTLARLDRVLRSLGDRQLAAEYQRECGDLLTVLELDEASLRLPPFLAGE